MGFLIRAALAALGLWLADYVLDGISFDEPMALLAGALLLGIVNAVVRPLVLLLTLPFTILTLGFFLLVVNAAMLGLVALVLDGFHIATFWSAVGASLIVSLVSWLGSSTVSDGGRIEIYTSGRRDRDDG